jgi:predicted aminopeptidase
MIKKVLTNFLQIVLLVVALCCLVWHEFILYGLSQAKGQLTIIYKAQPIDLVLKENTYPDSLAQKLILIQEIKKYAIDSLGITANANYSKVFNQQKQSVLLTVSACEPYSLKPKQWYYPILGNMPYKGFFDKEKAKKEINELKWQGYDVDVYSPSGWSTLGWFNDPVLSNMLYRSEGQLANLIIHELTHGTVFIKNDVEFNENLANFIGDKGAELFLAFKYGEQSKEYRDYEYGKQDEKKYTDYILTCVDSLDSLYQSISKHSENIKKEKKKQFITEIVRGVNQLSLYSKQRYFKFSLDAFHSKNAFFMAFQRYDSQYDFFEKEFKSKYHSNLKLYLHSFKDK